MTYCASVAAPADRAMSAVRNPHGPTYRVDTLSVVTPTEDHAMASANTPRLSGRRSAPDEAPTLLRVKEVAKLLSIPAHQVRRLPIPRIQLAPRTICYDPGDVWSYVEACRSNN